MASVIVAPIPTAAPLIAAMTGFLHAKIASVTRPPVSRTPLEISGSSKRCSMSTRSGDNDSSSPKTLPSEVRSMPAQNARPAPVTTIAPTVSSSLARSKTSTSSSAISTVNAFNCSGLDSVTVSTLSARSRINVRYVITVPSWSSVDDASGCGKAAGVREHLQSRVALSRRGVRMDRMQSIHRIGNVSCEWHQHERHPVAHRPFSAAVRIGPAPRRRATGIDQPIVVRRRSAPAHRRAQRR